MLTRKKRWDSKLNPRNAKSGDITEKRRSTFLASFQKLIPGINTPKKDEFIILGLPLGPKSQADLLEKKIIELENVNGIVEKLDAHYGYFMLKNGFSLPKLLLSENQNMFQSSSSLGKIRQNRTRRAFQSVKCELRRYFEDSAGSAR